VTAEAGGLRYAIRTLQPSTHHAVTMVAGACAGAAGGSTADLVTDARGQAAGILATAAVPPPLCFRVHAGPPDAPAQVVATAEVTAGAAAELRPAGAQAGSAELRYDHATRVLTVDVTVTGLAPGTEHPNHVHTGRCDQEGGLLHILELLKAGPDGTAHQSTSIPQVDQIQAGSWYVAVHQGPGLDAQAEFSPVLCGDVG
jgi:hypothetical protein